MLLGQQAALVLGGDSLKQEGPKVARRPLRRESSDTCPSQVAPQRSSHANYWRSSETNVNGLLDSLGNKESLSSAVSQMDLGRIGHAASFAKKFGCQPEVRSLTYSTDHGLTALSTINAAPWEWTGLDTERDTRGRPSTTNLMDTAVALLLSSIKAMMDTARLHTTGSEECPG